VSGGGGFGIDRCLHIAEDYILFLYIDGLFLFVI